MEDFRQATSELLGKGKFRGTLNPNIPNDFTFGIKTMKDSNWNVGKCLFGDSDAKTKEMLTPDVDLEKSVNYRFKNPKLHPIDKDKLDYSRMFGIPSVRSDLVEKERKSVCDYTVSL